MLSRTFKLPIVTFCDVKQECLCLRSNVSDLLHVEKNRPCIPYSKLGDEIEDCYNAYDEKNTFDLSDSPCVPDERCNHINVTVYMAKMNTGVHLMFAENNWHAVLARGIAKSVSYNV